MNPNYEKAVVATNALNKKASGLYGNLGAFVLDVAYANGIPAKGTDIKPLFKNEEQAAEAIMKIKMGENSTYRVIKNLFANCVMGGVNLQDGKGRLRGKSDLESELAALKEPKTAMEKFATAITTATKASDGLSASERLTAAKLASDLLDALANQLKMAA
jgi:hypothetical protein